MWALPLSAAGAVTAAATILSVVPAAASAAPAGPAASQTTNAVGVASDAGHPARAARVGDTAAATPMSVAIALRPRDAAGLEQFAKDVSDPASSLFRHFITPAEFNQRFAATPGQVDQVRRYLAAQGLTVTGVSGNRQVVDATGSAAQISAAFGTHEADYTLGGRSYRMAEGVVRLPADVAGLVSFVGGLSDAPVATHGAQAGQNAQSGQLGQVGQNAQSGQSGQSGAAQPGGSGPSGGESPSDLINAYSMSNTVSSQGGSGKTVGMLEFDGFKQSDIDTFTRQFSLPGITPTVAKVDGGVTSLGSGQIEVTLDIDSVAVYAPKAAQIVYEAPNTDSAWTDEWAKVASDNKVDVFSGSWLLGESCESSPIAATHDDVNQMVSQGITIVSASGDWGGHGCGYNGDNSTITADYPASDPGITGVGGTHLTTGSGGGYSAESVWNSGSTGNTRSGGGYSSVYATPSWQSAVNSNKMRGVPDVADAADPNAGGLSINLNGGWESVGGTSEAAPLWGGYLADAGQLAGKRLGNLNPTIYQVAGSSKYATDFHDVTQGNNDTYSATTGWDLATGWGTPIGDKLIGDLTNVSTPPPPTNDFSLTLAPASGSVQAGQSVTSTVTTKVTSGSAESITLSASGLPTGATATFNPASVTGGASSTLTIATTSSTPAGTYTVTVTGADTDATHSAAFSLGVTTPGGGGGNDVKNGGFESGTLGSWTRSGTASVVTAPVHGGGYAAKIGPGGSGSYTSGLSQTFTATSAGPLNVWYAQACVGQFPFGFGSITLTDNTSGTSQTLAQPQCSSPRAASYVKASANLVSGHSYTLAAQNQDLSSAYFGSSSVLYLDDVTDGSSV
ncbi:hypothetical protein GCM10009839_49760 [Catenulispora yoronensis]|uniref:Peptidase S53 domain-containing protein n=1 Tax=Catenulispora yoronensis TaxID=450799 RepID=A0ABN2UPK8_9ACTN